MGITDSLYREAYEKMLLATGMINCMSAQQQVHFSGRFPGSIAYLVSEFPVLSETFVYREIRMLQRSGIPVALYSLRERPANPKIDLQHVPPATILYSHLAALLFPLSALLMLMTHPKRSWKAWSWFVSDVRQMQGLGGAFKLLVQVMAGARLAWSLEKHGVQHLHVHFIHSPCQVAMYASAFNGIPYTVTAHANDIFALGELLLEKAERAHQLITISEFNLRHFLSMGVSPEKVRVVRCLLDLPESVDSGEDRDGVFRVGSLGRLVPKKGFATLIRAFKRLSEDLGAGAIELQIAGSGPQEDELKALTDSLGLSDQVKFVGALNPSEVFGWMQSLNCFALACETAANGNVDGIPVVLMEAMACGIPVVSTRLSGIPELVRHKDTGLLMEEGDLESLVEALEILIKDPEVGRELVSRAHQYLEEEFSKYVNLERLLKSFENPDFPLRQLI